MMATLDELPKHRQNVKECVFGRRTEWDVPQLTNWQYEIHGSGLVAVTLLLCWGTAALALWQLL
jgi:hypothetical protein